ncbi:hypothetical protein ACFL20_02870 [Spirochaetota bacterium]
MNQYLYKLIIFTAFSTLIFNGCNSDSVSHGKGEPQVAVMDNQGSNGGNSGPDANDNRTDTDKDCDNDQNDHNTGCGDDNTSDDNTSDDNCSMVLNIIPSYSEYKLLNLSISSPVNSNSGFFVKVNASITGGDANDVYSYSIYRDALWSYTSVHMGKVTSGTLIDASGFNWGAEFNKDIIIDPIPGEYNFTVFFGFRSGAHGWYDLARDISVNVVYDCFPPGDD